MTQEKQGRKPDRVANSIVKAVLVLAGLVFAGVAVYQSWEASKPADEGKYDYILEDLCKPPSTLCQ